MSWHTDLNKRLDRIEASTRRIKAHFVRFIARQTGQSEAQVWARLLAQREQQLTANAAR